MAKKNLPYPAEKIGELLIEVDNEVAKKSDLNDFVKKESGRGLSTNDYTTAEKTKLAGIQEGAQKNTVTSVRGALQLNPQVGNVVISAADIGLGNANTRLTSLENNKLDKSEKGATNGVASLDENGRVPSSQLPSYVGDVIEVANYESLPTSGESGKIYITQSDNKTYRWSGKDYAEISASLALGETEQTAYSGAKGKQNAEDIAKLAKDLDETHQLASNAESAISEVVELTIPAIESNVANKATKSEAQGYATTAKSEAITAAATDAQNKANAAESNAKTYADGKVKGLADGQVATNTTAIASLQTAQTSTATTVKSHSDTISTHTQQITNLDSNKLGKTEKAADSAKADYATSAGSATNATNANSATKLATPRNLWGQSFDGSGDVSGEMTISGDGRKVVNVKSKAASDYVGLIAYMSTSSPTSETGGVVFNGSSATYKYGVNALNVFNTRGDIHYEAATNYHHVFHNELKFAVVADQDLCAGVRTAFKTSIAQIGALIGNHFYLGKEATDKYIRFRKYAGTSNAAPSSITDLMTIDTSGNVVINGTMTAVATYHSSDERLKTFEGDVEVDLEKLKALPKKYFHWTADADGKRQLGTSAQAVEEVFPELVSTNADGYKSVNYANLSIVALAAVDKLAEKNAELERRLAKIEKLLNIE